MAGYVHNKENAEGKSRKIVTTSEHPTKTKGSPQNERETLVKQKEVAPSLPQRIAGAFEHEPMASFLTNLTSKEYYMFQYCKLSS